MRPRRFLPTVSLLTALEAVLRTGSTAAAARELDLSQGTVSRLIQNLEAQLGHALFDRHRQRLVPTEAARVYGRDVTRALDLIQRGSLEFAANPLGAALSLATLPAFGSQWLVPRLGRFTLAHPGIAIHLATRLKRFNFAAEGFDAAIHFGADDWREAGHLKLFDERLTACAAPDLIGAHPVTRAADLHGLPLLRLETRPTAWDLWFAAQGGRAPAGGGMLFDQFAPMSQAAITGLGVALLPDYLAVPEQRAGRLVPLLRPSVEGTGAYWLVWPAARAEYPPLRAFRSWLAEASRDALTRPDEASPLSPGSDGQGG
ncbi:LysR family transcriptional regulator [Methylobacterium soli]|uniref:LysR family transcriptional regulator n=1 Tax=Methylobacterium soli TaxID=553447 RepID=A0A6L3T5E3_9HYPH|nr:LysR family transcriptional regulator [Methylobacterium soli]KAB1080298.1 LysR family transcriptional regulator [Methylobacterium soli]GJE44726.1 HTH-type transcriptional regulator PerR [Methylobacterium soli]